MRLCFFLTFVLFSQSPWARAALSLQDRLEDLHQLKEVIATDYGPLEWKREHLGLDLDRLTRTYEERAAEVTEEEFPYLLLQFVAEFHDSHFRALAPSKQNASLGFTTDSVEGRVLIEEIDRNRLPFALFPFQKGDELVSFAGHPVMEEIAKLESYGSMGTEEAAQNLAVYSLPFRAGKRLPVPTGNVVLGIRTSSTKQEVPISLSWHEETAAPSFRAEVPLAGIGNWCAEKSRIDPPAGAEIVPGVPFTAFTFDSPRGKIGFLRIPHYYPVNEQGEEIAALRFRQYEEVVRKFEANTVGLLIDQDFNCGGSVVYANKMLSLFLRAPFTPAEFSFRASKGQIAGLSGQLEKFPSSTNGYGRFARLLDEVKRAKEEGKPMSPRIPVWGFLEVKLDLEGNDQIEPNAIGYSKPIVMLVNEMSGSGGDLFPAMMKDLGRAHLFGTHTMGAGGHVWSDPPIVLRHTGIDILLTRSLIYRPNGKLIENQGVEADTHYEITKRDFLEGYRPYLEAATAELMRWL